LAQSTTTPRAISATWGRLRQPSWGVGGRSQGATLDQDQRPTPGVLCLDGGRPGGRRDSGLPL